MDTLVRDLDAEAATIAGHLNVQHAHAVALIAELLDSGGWQGHGIASPEHWVKLRFGVSHPRARTIVAVARRFSEFPSTMSEFTAGALSLEQVEAVIRLAPAWADSEMAGFAGGLTVSQLRRVVREEYFDGPAASDSAAAQDADAVDEPTEASPAVPSQPTDFFAFDWVNGRLVGSFDIAGDRGTAIDAVFQRVRDELFRETGSPATNAETFAELVARAGAAPTDLLSLEWGNGSRLADTLGRLRTFLHLDLTDDGHQLLARLSNGVALPEAMRHYLTCDGCITPVWERDNVPVGYGRDVRIVPTKLRRQVERRDRGCRVPGCGAKHVEVHHIVHWLNGGVTEIWNLVSLCPTHHRLHHIGQLLIRGNPGAPGELEFFDATGEQIRGPSFVRPAAPPPSPTKGYDSPTGEHMDLRWFGGWSHEAILNVERLRAAWRQAHPN